MTVVTQRTERVDQLLREEIGAILTRDVADPRIGFATITAVETAPDLRHARVWVSVIGTDAERTETIRALERAMSFVRRELGTRLRLRRIPELHVRLDDTAERGTRVLRLLSDLDAGTEPTATELSESLPTPVPRIRHEGDVEEDLEPCAAGDPPPVPRRRGRGRASGQHRGRRR
jgi:ribosome-binding factor A